MSSGGWRCWRLGSRSGLLLVAFGNRLVSEAIRCLITGEVAVARDPVEGERHSYHRQCIEEFQARWAIVVCWSSGPLLSSWTPDRESVQSSTLLIRALEAGGSS